MMTDEQERELERDAMSGVRTLLAAGFMAIPIGDPAAPDMMLFIRDRLDVRDAVKMYGPKECEAVRIVRQKIVTEASGTVPDVVAQVIAWSLLGGL